MKAVSNLPNPVSAIADMDVVSKKEGRTNGIDEGREQNEFNEIEGQVMSDIYVEEYPQLGEGNMIESIRNRKNKVVHGKGKE